MDFWQEFFFCFIITVQSSGQQHGMGKHMAFIGVYGLMKVSCSTARNDAKVLDT